MDSLSEQLQKDANRIRGNIKGIDSAIKEKLKNIPEGDEGIHFYKTGRGNSLVEIFSEEKTLGDNKYNLLGKNIPSATEVIITRGKINGDFIPVHYSSMDVYAGGDVSLEKSAANRIFSGGNITIDDSENMVSSSLYAKGDVTAGSVGHGDAHDRIVAGKNITVLSSKSELFAGGDIEVVGVLDNSAHALGSIKADLVRADFLPEYLYAGGDIVVKNALANMRSGRNIIFTGDEVELCNTAKAKGSISAKKVDSDYYNSEEAKKMYGDDCPLVASKLYSTDSKHPEDFKGEFIHIDDWKKHIEEMTRPLSKIAALSSVGGNGVGGGKQKV